MHCNDLIRASEINCKSVITQDLIKVFVFNSRCSFEMVSGLTDKYPKNKGIIFSDSQKDERKDIFLSESKEVCERWNDVLSDFLNQRRFG